ncbi:MAG: M48 family metallopeptidase [Tepidisphaeraceae bacterium]|jgi:Zn-dependent protease with chaperone function
MRVVRSIVLTAFFALTAGCQSAPLSQSVNAWVAHQGGIIPGSEQARAEAVARPLFACCHGRTISIQVLNSNAVGAFSWRNGRVYVTRGLMDRLSDHELAAVISHELGHLLSDGQLQTVASISGCRTDPDREVRADAAGLALLRASGLPPQAMVSMLEKIEFEGSLPPNCRVAMQRRIAIISAQIQ